MTPLTAPTLCLETEESTEPPPSTLYLASQSHQLCLRPRLAPRSSPVCTRTLAAHCTARMSRSVRASSACQGHRRGVVGARTQATGAPRVRELLARRRAIALRHMRMDATATSGCSMTSVSRMLSRRDMGGSSERITKSEEGFTRFVTLLASDTTVTTFRLNETRNQHNNITNITIQASSPSVSSVLHWPVTPSSLLCCPLSSL